MAATFNTILDTGGSDNSPGASATVTNLRFNVADDNDQDTGNPVPIPSAGTNYSFWKQVYLECTGAPDTQVDNMELYSDGTAFDANVALNVGNELPVHTSGDTTGYDLATAAEVMTNHTDITGVTNINDFTSGGSEKTITIGEAGNIIDDVGETTHYVVLQVAVGTGASPGTLAAEEITWQYDEI